MEMASDGRVCCIHSRHGLVLNEIVVVRNYWPERVKRRRAIFGIQRFHEEERHRGRRSPAGTTTRRSSGDTDGRKGARCHGQSH